MPPLTLKTAEARKARDLLTELESMHTPEKSKPDKVVFDHTPFDYLHEENAGEPHEFCPACKMLKLARDLKTLITPA